MAPDVSRRRLLSGLGSLALGGRAAAQAGADIVKLAGDQHQLLLRADGSVLGWGPMAAGQLGPAAAQAARRGRTTGPVPIGLPGRVRDIAAGALSSCAVLDDGSVWAWGSGEQGALGMGEGLRQGSAEPMRVPGIAGAAQLVAHGATVAVLLQDGGVCAWGSRRAGRLGDGQHPKQYGTDGSPAWTPVAVPGLPPVRQLAIGASQVLALTREGRVWAWGSNAEGALGRLPRQELPLDSPAEVPGLADVVAVAAGQGVSTVLKRDGTVWVWGANWHGQFGNGERTDPPGMQHGWEVVPQRVPGIAGVVAIAVGMGRQTLVLLKDGSLRGWGNTDWGQIGAGVSADFQERPVTPRIAGVKAVYALGNTSYAVRVDGSLWAWGAGERGAWPLAANTAIPVRISLG